jgi:hypothetical protein
VGSFSEGEASETGGSTVGEVPRGVEEGIELPGREQAAEKRRIANAVERARAALHCRMRSSTVLGSREGGGEVGGG